MTASRTTENTTKADTGRGAQSMCTLESGSVMIAIPEALMISTATVLESQLGQYIKRHPKELDPLQCLCLFLMVEQCKGNQSDWFPYLQVVPSSYTNAAYWTEAQISLLPSWVQPAAQEHRKNLQTSFQGAQSFLKFLPEQFQDQMTFDRYRWAWSTVNTRAVYWLRPMSVYLKNTKKDCLALAPVLDLLNHSCEANIKAAFNEKNHCYEIRTFSQYKRYSQAFISYGPHENSKLLVEYGFLLPDNPHDAVPFYLEDIIQCCMAGSPNTADLTAWIYENELHKSLSIDEDGSSWNLNIVLRLCAMTDKERHIYKSCCLQGNVVTMENEETKEKLYGKLLHWALEQIHKEWPELQKMHDHEKMANTLCEQHRTLLQKCLKDT